MSGRPVAVGMFLIAVVVLPAPAGAASDGPGPATVWEASDRLDPHPDAPGPAGLHFRIGATSYEAVPEVWASMLRASREPLGGFGARILWRRFWLSRGPATDRLGVHFVRRGADFRLTGGVRVETQGDRHAARLLVRWDREWAPGLLAGLRLGLDPEAADGGAEASVLVHLARGVWMGGVELGGGTGLRRIATGLRLAGALVWTAALVGTEPTTGLAVRIRNSEIRVEETRHALLGRVTVVRWVLGGLLP